MATIVSPRTQHIAALADITHNHNVPEVKSNGRDKRVRFVPVTSPSTRRYKRTKYKPTVEEDNYRKILESRDLSALLSSDNISIFADSSNTPPSPNMSKSRDKIEPSPPLAAPTTPPLAQLDGGQIIAMKESGATLPKLASPTIPLSYKGSPLNKPLPLKPADRPEDSPERPGLLDATEKDNVLSIHPALHPKISHEESPTSFKVASSLGSTPSSLVADFGTGVIVEGQMVNFITGQEIEYAKSTSAVHLRAILENGSPIHRVKRLSSMPSNSSLNRRQSRAGVGLTIRKSADAHEIIMGTPDPTGSPHPPRTSSLPQVRSSSLSVAVKSTGQLSTAARLSRPTAASAARAAQSKKSMLTPGRNLLNRASASKASLVSSANRSVTSVRSLNKSSPAVSGSSASLPKSNTVDSIKKGLKSRISEIFSNRRRSIPSSFNNDKKGYATIIDEEEDIILEADLDSPQFSPVSDKTSPKSPATYPGSDKKTEDNSSSKIRGNKKLPLTGELSNREHSAKVQELQVTPFTERLTAGMLAPREARRTHRGDAETPSPPPSRDGAVGHYTEGDNHRGDSNDMTEEEFDSYLEAQLHAAEDHLEGAIAAVQHDPTDEIANQHIRDVIQALGESVIAARTAHMAGIRLRIATSNLIQNTTLRAANTRNVIAAAGQVTSRVVPEGST